MVLVTLPWHIQDVAPRKEGWGRSREPGLRPRGSFTERIKSEDGDRPRLKTQKEVCDGSYGRRE